MRCGFHLIIWMLVKILIKLIVNLGNLLSVTESITQDQMEIVSLRQEGKFQKILNPTRICLQINHDRIKEIIGHFNRLDATVTKHT